MLPSRSLLVSTQCFLKVIHSALTPMGSAQPNLMLAGQPSPSAEPSPAKRSKSNVGSASSHQASPPVALSRKQAGHPSQAKATPSPRSDQSAHAGSSLALTSVGALTTTHRKHPAQQQPILVRGSSTHSTAQTRKRQTDPKHDDCEL